MNVGMISANLFEAFHANNPVEPGQAIGMAKPDEERVSQKTAEPTYAEAFPPLPATVDGPAGQSAPSSPKSSGGSAVGVRWNKMSLKSSTTTQVFSVPLEERRFREMSEAQQFGDRGKEQAKICSDIMNITGVTIEMSLAKDQSLTVVITGKQEAVLRARKMMVEKLQTQTKATMHIPKEHHRYILGAKGRKLLELELQTATKISVPRPNENSDAVTITGTKEGIDKARQELQLVSDEQAKLALERLIIPKVYHPFICGPDNQIVRDLMEQTGARISVPPHSYVKDEIVISGEKEGVQHAKQTIMAIFEEKKRKTTTVSVEVKKSQHRYIIGMKGNGLSEILAETGVSVEVPPIETLSETITLRGDPDRLGSALTLVYAKANSIVLQEVAAAAWLHRFVIGRQGANVRRITQDYPRVHIEFTDELDHIRIEGPPDDVDKAKGELEEIIKDLVARMAFVELDIDPKYHRHIIGRGGANITRIKNEYDVDVRVPSDAENSRVVRIEGVSEGVAQAKQELLDLVDKMENEKSRDVLVDHRLHRLIIGTQGVKIREVRDKFPNVVISIPDASQQSDVIRLRGPKGDVDRCHAYLQKFSQDLEANNQTAEVHIFKQYYRDVIGRNGVNLQKIREETDTRIEMPSESSDCYNVLITGTKDNVEKAKEMLEASQMSLARIKEETVDIPPSQHAMLLGSKGQLIRAIRDECGGVMIRFPSAASNSSKVLVKGPAEDVERAKKQLMELAAEQKEQHCTLEMKAKPEHHRFLIGRNGANVREVQKRTGVRIMFPQSDCAGSEQDVITLIGRQEAIEAVRQELETKLQELDNVVELEMLVDSKHHRHFIVRKGELLNQISEEFGGMIVSFPRLGVKSNKVVLKGAKNCVEGARDRILDIVKDLESQTTIECVIAQKFHGLVMGPKGQNVHAISRDYNVNIRLPERPPPAAPGVSNHRGAGPPESDWAAEPDALGTVPDPETSNFGNEGPSNGSGEGVVEGADFEERVESEEPVPAVKKQDIILITGKLENCEAAKEALLALLPVTEEMTIANEMHRYIIGQKGQDIRRIMADFSVNISFPPANNKSDIVKIIGTRPNVDKTREALEQRVEQLHEEKEQRALRSFRLEVVVDPKHHPKIIGRRGAVINRIRQDHDVQIQFPERGNEASDVIVITGLEQCANAAKDDILKMVQDLEGLVVEEVILDHRIHSRLIGSRGRGIHKIMDDYKVDIRFPGRDAPDPDLVVISGSSEDAVMECKDHLLNLEDEFLQDVTEQETAQQFRYSAARDDEEKRSDSVPPSSNSASVSNGGGKPPQQQKDGGFTVRGAPWSAPDTASKDDFPDLGGASAQAEVQHTEESATPAVKKMGNYSANQASGGGVKWGPVGRH